MKAVMFLCAMVAIAVGAVPLSAHHAFSAEFDANTSRQHAKPTNCFNDRAPRRVPARRVVCAKRARAAIQSNKRMMSLQVLVRDNNIDQALRVLKKKMQREGLFREMKQRRAYEKPSERKTREKSEAVRRARSRMRCWYRLLSSAAFSKHKNWRLRRRRAAAALTPPRHRSCA